MYVNRNRGSHRLRAGVGTSAAVQERVPGAVRRRRVQADEGDGDGEVGTSGGQQQQV